VAFVEQEHGPAALLVRGGLETLLQAADEHGIGAGGWSAARDGDLAAHVALGQPSDLDVVDVVAGIGQVVAQAAEQRGLAGAGRAITAADMRASTAACRPASASSRNGKRRSWSGAISRVNGTAWQPKAARRSVGLAGTGASSVIWIFLWSLRSGSVCVGSRRRDRRRARGRVQR